MSPKRFALGTVMASAASVVWGFRPPSAVSRSMKTSTTSLRVAVDPSTITQKEYRDICGVSFDEGDLSSRLQATNFLYPKHVEVIEDIAPIAGAMVDEIVSLSWRP